jgi:phosphatidylserine/phosphatidylglycerophosphate/cardiolipin synthase-like enzyme
MSEADISITVKYMRNFFLRPGSGIPDEIFAILHEKMLASKACKFGMAYLTHQKIAEFLRERSDKGLPTQILLNARDLIRPSDNPAAEIQLAFPVAVKNIFEIIERLGDDTLLIRVLNARNTMHHKFLVFDDLVGFGSLNFTYAGFNQNYENFSFTDDLSVVSNFGNEFDALWEIASDLRIDNGHLRNLVCPKCNREEGIDFESWGLLCTLCGARFEFKKV